MLLTTHRWGDPSTNVVVCLHGVAQHGGVFDELGRRLSARGHSVLAVDLRGHGDSGREPPWDTATHLHDVLETLDQAGVARASWIGHSFGGRLAAAIAAEVPARTERLALLDPGLDVPPQIALQSAEIERLDWSFATADGAVNALLSSASMVAPPRETVAGYVADDVRKGSDGRYRFRFCPSAAVVAWNEVTLPAPPVVRVPTLVVKAERSLFDAEKQRLRYTGELGDLLTVVTVPNGHNVLWESPAETIGAVERFLGEGAG